MIITATDPATVSIQTKNTTDATLLWYSNPLQEKGGRIKSADIVLCSSQLDASKSNENSVLTIDHPGEYEIKGVFIVGLESQHHNPSSIIMFAIDLEGIRILLIPGTISDTLTQEHLSTIGSVDMVIIAAESQSSPILADIVKQIEPRVVLIAESPSSQAIVKKIGLPSERISKLKLTKKELPQEHTNCYLLTNE